MDWRVLLFSRKMEHSIGIESSKIRLKTHWISVKFHSMCIKYNPIALNVYSRGFELHSTPFCNTPHSMNKYDPTVCFSHNLHSGNTPVILVLFPFLAIMQENLLQIGLTNLRSVLTVIWSFCNHSVKSVHGSALRGQVGEFWKKNCFHPLWTRSLGIVLWGLNNSSSAISNCNYDGQTVVFPGNEATPK
jgi:hypothetical protein